MCYQEIFKVSVSMLIVAMLGGIANPVAARDRVETLALFDPSVPETPESIVFDRRDNAYITLALTGEVRKITPRGEQSTLAVLPIGAPCGGQPVAALGLAIDRHDRLYVSVLACDPSSNGIWHLPLDGGAPELIANLPSGTLGNGIDIFRGQIYIADSLGGMIWRVPQEGGLAEIWLDHPLLAPGPVYPGPNGVRFFRRELYVANSSSGDIVAVRVRRDGTPGEPRVHTTLPGSGCDEFAFDVRGRIYCTTDPFNTVVRLDPDGSSKVLLTAADGLDGPTSAAFGRQGRNRKWLYITNAAFPFYTTTFRPSLMRLRLEVPGLPN